MAGKTKVIEGSLVVEQSPPQRQAIAVVSEGASLMSMIERIASDPAADIEKMERLMAMKEKIEAAAAKKEYGTAMSLCQSEIPAIVTNKTNTHTNSKYANLETINAAIVPIYTKHGFSLSFDNEEPRAAGWIRVRCTVFHSGGHSETFHYDSPVDDEGTGGKKTKTEVHGIASATSYCRRYLTLMIFNIAIRNEDNDGNGAKKKDAGLTEKQEAVLREWIEAAQADLVDFLEYFGAESVREISAKRYDEALAGLKQKAKLVGAA